MKLKKLLGNPHHDCPPEMSDAALAYRDLEFEQNVLKLFGCHAQNAHV